MAVLKGDQEQMDRAVSSGQGQAQGGTLDGPRGGSRSGSFRPLAGRPAVIQPSHGSGPARGGTRAAASYQAARAVWEAVSGNAAEAKRNAMAALEQSKGRDVEYAAGFALALSGDSSRSEALADDLEKRFPEDTFVKFTYVPVLRGLAALGGASPPTAWSGCKSLCPMSWRRMASTSCSISWRFALGLCARRGLDGRAAVCGSRGRISEDSRSSRDRGRWIPSVRWRTCNSAGCSLCRETGPRRRLPMRPSWHCGRMQTPISRS